MKTYEDKWDESYNRHENFIFYPKEQYVIFLNRFVRKRIGIDKFIDILDLKGEGKALDYGCGIGRLTILLREFKLDAYGVDISSMAIANAKKLASIFGHSDMEGKFLKSDGMRIPFPDFCFDITICEGVLDSMNFELAKIIMNEINRVTKSLAFISLISGDDSEHYREYAGEEIVETLHEKDTIQSYFNIQKIRELIGDTEFKMRWCRLLTEESVLDRFKYGRYYVVLEK
jgi:ubiquinone/menaquinone biosynthesis C-methylase UbiE